MVDTLIVIEVQNEVGIDEGGILKDTLNQYLSEALKHKDLFFFNPDKQLYYPNGFSEN